MVYVVPLRYVLIVPCSIKFIKIVKGGAGYSSTAKCSMVSKWEWVNILIIIIITLTVTLIPLSKLVLNGMSV